MVEPLTSQRYELDGFKPAPGMQVSFSAISDYGGYTAPMTLPIAFDS